MSGKKLRGVVSPTRRSLRISPQVARQVSMRAALSRANRSIDTPGNLEHALAVCKNTATLRPACRRSEPGGEPVADDASGLHDAGIRPRVRESQPRNLDDAERAGGGGAGARLWHGRGARACAVVGRRLAGPAIVARGVARLAAACCAAGALQR